MSDSVGSRDIIERLRLLAADQWGTDWVPLDQAEKCIHEAAEAAVRAAADTRTREIIDALKKMADESEPEAARAFVWFAAAEIEQRFPVSDCEGDTDG